jgi:archaemetzincin
LFSVNRIKKQPFFVKPSSLTKGRIIYTRVALLQILLVTLLTHISCGTKPIHESTLILQPLGEFNPVEAKVLKKELSFIFKNIQINKPLPFPANAYNRERKRYRADTLLKFLALLGTDDNLVLGLCSKDISVTKGEIQDWGVMGFAYRPGNVCVASTFRLHVRNTAEQFYKVVIHELGHTAGLSHCKEKSCYMRVQVVETHWMRK